MAIGTYAQLQTALQNWTQRSDISSRAPEWITMAESAFNRGFDSERPFRAWAQEAVTTTSNTTTVGIASGFVLPTDFLELRAIRTTTAPYKRLQYIAPEAGDQLYNTSSLAGGNHFTLQGGFLRTFSDATSLQITYYQKIPALATTDPNWLLTAHPDIYLFGSLLHGHVYSQNDPALATVIAGYNNAVNGLRNTDRMLRYGGGELAIKVG